MKILCVQFLGRFQKVCLSGLSFVQWTRSSNNSLSLGFKRSPIWFRERRKRNGRQSDIHKRYFPKVRDAKAVKKKKRIRNAQRWEITGQTQQESTWARFLSSTEIHGETWNWGQFFRNQISEFGVYCLSQVCPHVTLLVVWKCWQHYKLNNAISFPFFEQVGSGVCQNNRKIHFLLDLFSCLGGNLSKRGVAYTGQYRFITQCH